MEILVEICFWLNCERVNENGRLVAVNKEWLLNRGSTFRAEKRSAQASAHLLSQAQGGLFCVLTACVDCVRLCVFVSGVLSEMHEVGTFAPCEAFLFDMFAFFFVA